MEFKAGDRVICVNADGSDDYLILNKQYTVKQYIKYEHDHRIILYGLKSREFYTHRFILDEKYYRKEKLKRLKNGI